MNRTGLLIALACAAAVGLLFGLYPKLDLSISAAFYDRPQHDWPVTRNDLLILHRNASAYLAAILVIFAVGSVAVGAIRRGRPALTSWRAAAFLLGSLLLGPGLIVNVLLKPEWARPRPADRCWRCRSAPRIARWSATSIPRAGSGCRQPS